MTVTLKPIDWDPPKEIPGGRASKREGFLWPNPPQGGYPAAKPQTEPLPCEIHSLNDQRVAGRMTFFVPEERVLHVQLPRARTTLALRFDQIRAITLTAPIAPLNPPVLDPQSGALRQPGQSRFKLRFTSGSKLAGETVGHVENGVGLFLFPPASDDGSVQRLFIPRSAYVKFELDSSVAAPPSAAAEMMLSRVVTTPDQLLEAIEQQTRMPMVRIGEALISLGMITAAQLQEALGAQQGDRRVPLGELLVRQNAVSRADLQVALARKMGYPLVDLDTFPAEAEALRKISYSAAQRLQVMPLLVRDGRLIVALDDPANRRSAVDEVEFIAQMKAVPVLAQCRDMERMMFAAYDKIGAAADSRPGSVALQPIEFVPDDTSELLETLEKEGKQDRPDDDTPIEQSDNSLVRMINSMILEAHREGVSDIHIESYPGQEKTRIRFRRDGRLYTYLELPSSYRNAIVGRVKIMCDLDISEKRKPQDGKINFAKFSPQHRIELRVATIPTANGLEDVVRRILASAKPLPLDQLGLSDRNLSRLKAAIERPYGMVLCVGPTGSGKTTTLHSALMHINTPERKIWTAEDPIEITQPGLRQVQVNPRIDWTFAKALRAFVRADPDVIMVGEIRDEETAKTAIEASLTGHLVLSTLHTNSAPETVTRLLDMGLDPFNFADSLLAVLAQRLVRRLCTHCISSRPATSEEIEELLADYLHAFGKKDSPAEREAVLKSWQGRHARDGRLMHFASAGCKRCGETGFKGRVGIHELMVMSKTLRRLVQNGARAEELQEAALREGMRTLRQDGIAKVLSGQTTIEEVRATSNV